MTDLELFLIFIQRVDWAYKSVETADSIRIEIKNTAKEEVDFLFNKTSGKATGFTCDDNMDYYGRNWSD